MKKCSKCKVNKKNERFYKATKEKDGLQSWCILCMKQAVKDTYVPVKKKYLPIKAPVGHIQCHKCLQFKSKFSFSKRKDTATGYQYNCKLCMKKRNKKTYIKKSKLKNPTIKRDKLKPLMYSFEKFCYKCDKVKDKKEFNKNKSMHDGLQAYCRPCQQKDNRRTHKIRMNKLKKEAYNKMANDIKEKQIKDNWKKDWKEMKAPTKKSWCPNWLYDLMIK